MVSTLAGWLWAGILAFILGASFHLDEWPLALGPDDIATEQLVASAVAELGAQPAAKPAARPWYKNTREYIRIACQPNDGYINGSRDIQCVDANGTPTGYAYRSWGKP
jgi:hypothetical protein